MGLTNIRTALSIVAMVSGSGHAAPGARGSRMQKLKAPLSPNTELQTKKPVSPKPDRVGQNNSVALHVPVCCQEFDARFVFVSANFPVLLRNSA